MFGKWWVRITRGKRLIIYDYSTPCRIRASLRTLRGNLERCKVDRVTRKLDENIWIDMVWFQTIFH